MAQTTTLRSVSSLASHLASAVDARSRCASNGNTEWFARHGEAIASMQRDHLPHGSGINGTHEPLEIGESRHDRLVFIVPFHAMNEHGFYCGWYSYKVVAVPTFDGVSVKVSRLQRKSRDFDDDGAMEWIADTFRGALNGQVGWNEAGEIVAAEGATQ